MSRIGYVLLTACLSLIFITFESAATGWFYIDETTQVDAVTFPQEEPIDGSSTIVRHHDKVGFSFTSRELIPGNVYTLWIMNFDKPRKCFEPCGCTLADFGNPDVNGGAVGALTGRVADDYGQLDLQTTLEYGELPDNAGQILVPGPIKNRRAHLLLILRDHGPASTDPDILDQQLTTWAGGCDAYSCQDVVSADHPSPYCRAPRR